MQNLNDGHFQPQAPNVCVQRLADGRPENAVEMERKEVVQPCQIGDGNSFVRWSLVWSMSRLTRRR
jgi:hypothetical protein